VASPIIFLLIHSIAIKLQEKNDSIDEEYPRPTSSTWSYIMHPIALVGSIEKIISKLLSRRL